jgi:hypothetical protein
LRQVLRLTKSGVPWEVATNLSSIELLAYCVAIGELEGGKFNWRRMEWESNKA